MRSGTPILLALMATAAAMILGCGKKAPDLTLSGTVVDASSGTPIQGASISDESYGPEPRQSAITDSSGRYSYRTWAEEHTIVVKAPGYKTQAETLAGPGQAEKTLDFKLTRE